MKVELPLEEGKTYKTKFQTGELFTVTKIVLNSKGERIISVRGIYESCKHLGECPINIDRLIPDFKEVLDEPTGSCPCLYLEAPCDTRCTCVDHFSSFGCMFCCTYGSINQRKQKAIYLKEIYGESI